MGLVYARLGNDYPLSTPGLRCFSSVDGALNYQKFLGGPSKATIFALQFDSKRGIDFKGTAGAIHLLDEVTFTDDITPPTNYLTLIQNRQAMGAFWEWMDYGIDNHQKKPQFVYHFGQEPNAKITSYCVVRGPVQMTDLPPPTMYQGYCYTVGKP
jgi:hypothetical protein